ncbi:winged helix-turn-helix domain-containing protein [Paenibacillus sp. GCM10027627]
MEVAIIHFEQDTYEAVFAGESIVFLPKEFALLRYLFEHEGRSFTRDELLDAVWPLEAPSDRTVDDHIYRIRKKLAGWAHLLRLETIRGQGYKLTRLSPAPKQNPLLEDEQFAADIRNMYARYHSLGMGSAMRLLAANRDILGLPGDPYYDAYLHFVRGDVEGLLKAETIGASQKAAYAVFIYATIQSDYKASLRYIEQLLAKGDLLASEWMLDLRLSAIVLYLKLGMLAKAGEEIESIRPGIEGIASPSFTAVFLLKEMYWHLLKDELDAASAKLEECARLLEEHPIQRERGAYLVAKAILLYRRGETRSARQILDEGMETTLQTQFVPHLLTHLHTILNYLDTSGSDEAYRQKYKRQWDMLATERRFTELAALTERWLQLHL